MPCTSHRLANIFNKMHLPKVKAIRTLCGSRRICLKTAEDPGEECCFYLFPPGNEPTLDNTRYSGEKKRAEIS